MTEYLAEITNKSYGIDDVVRVVQYGDRIWYCAAHDLYLEEDEIIIIAQLDD